MKHLHRSYDQDSATILGPRPFPYTLLNGDAPADPEGSGRGDASLGRQAGRLNLPRYFITWSGHLQACVQDWPSCNRGVFPAVDHDRSRT